MKVAEVVEAVAAVESVEALEAVESMEAVEVSLERSWVLGFGLMEAGLCDL